MSTTLTREASPQRQAIEVALTLHTAASPVQVGNRDCVEARQMVFGFEGRHMVIYGVTQIREARGPWLLRALGLAPTRLRDHVLYVELEDGSVTEIAAIKKVYSTYRFDKSAVLAALEKVDPVDYEVL